MAMLIDFDSALQCNNAEVLEDEFRGLEKELSDMSEGVGWSRAAQEGMSSMTDRIGVVCRNYGVIMPAHRETVVLILPNTLSQSPRFYGLHHMPSITSASRSSHVVSYCFLLAIFRSHR